MFGLNNNDNNTVNVKPSDSYSPPTQIPNLPLTPPPMHQANGDDHPDIPDDALPAPSSTDMPVSDSSTAMPSAPPVVDPTQPAEPLTAPASAVADLPTQDELLQIKQEALQNLTPLVGNLNQTPEEKFKTTMMLIQASDNPALVKEAYTAANAITDEKARANAILDVVNEINYFTRAKN